MEDIKSEEITPESDLNMFKIISEGARKSMDEASKRAEKDFNLKALDTLANCMHALHEADFSNRETISLIRKKMHDYAEKL